MLQKSGDRGGVKHTRVVRVETEVVIPLLDARVQGAVVAAEADREEVVLLRRVPQQERALGLPLQERLGLVAVHHAPVAGVARDLKQVGHEAVNVVDLRVHLPGALPADVGVAVPRRLALLRPPRLQAQRGRVLLRVAAGLGAGAVPAHLGHSGS